MHPLLSLLLVLLAGIALLLAALWLERRLKRPGLAFLIASGLALVGAISSLTTGARLQAALFLLQAVLFPFAAHRRRQQAPAEPR